MIKFKFDIGHGEIVNGWGWVTRLPNGQYEIVFSNDYGYDYSIKFDPKRRVFYGYD